MQVTEVREALDRTLWEFEERGYLGMSQIGQCPLKLYRDMMQGRVRPNVTGLRLCHEGYLHEHDLVARLAEAGLPLLEQQREVTAPWDERFKGHIDGTLAGVLVEIKSLNREKFAEMRREGPFGYHVEQVQCYMHFGGWRAAWIIYKNREDGDVWVSPLRYDEGIGILLERKGQRILAAVDGQSEAPQCTCGRCRGR